MDRIFFWFENISDCFFVGQNSSFKLLMVAKCLIRLVFLWNVCLMFWFWWILQFQYTIHFPTSNVHELIHPFSPFVRYNARLNMNNYGKFICFFQSHSMNCMDESIHAKFPSSSWLHGEIVDKRSASRFNRQRHVFDVFWCSKVVKSTVFYGDICHLKRRMSLRKNMRESSKKDYQWW